ncbi:MAG: molybdenum cofactor biosynthesis protein MoaE [Flavobacteriaceae bacterium TMED220]|jgi:molybdopterin synthase catalytic subunit|nr:MAG: molybdenum cofactor biosynthesis protein MoaE [Flavobacteriaceae bacterium TMED220]|tara:strand:- start:267 stop:698 length:432 start_codon:yes stop_codon:yes gene_type:complete
MKKIFIDGPISPEFISDSISKHQSKHNIGAHNIFLGQVRADIISDQNVKSIEYSAYEDMANKKVNEIREDAFKKFDLTCLHTYHSLGNIKVGEISFFVFVSSVRRSEVYEATQYLVDRIKNEVPIFGKEIFENEKFQWKENIN